MTKLNDDAMVNLKLISKIEKNIKVTTKNNIIESQVSFLPECVSRYFNGEDRTKSLTIIRNIIYAVIQLSDSEMNSTNMNIYDIKSDDITRFELDQFYNSCNTLKQFSIGLDESSIGIKNFQETYADDGNIVSNVEVLLKTIQKQITKIERKLEQVKYKKEESN
jgi:hypothetical protein